MYYRSCYRIGLFFNFYDVWKIHGAFNALIDARKGGEKDPSSDILVKKSHREVLHVDQDPDLAHISAVVIMENHRVTGGFQ